MGIMAGFVMWWSLLSLALLLGFGYIVWVLSAKESGGIKLCGQVLAVAIVVLSLILFAYGAVNGRAMKGRGCPMMGGKGMMGKGMMMEGKEGRKMEKMMEKCKEMKKEMKKDMKKMEKGKEKK